MRIDTAKMRRRRVQNTTSYIRENNLDGLLVNSWDNVRYITDTRPVLLTEWYAEGSFCLFNGRDKPVVSGYQIGKNLEADFVDPTPFPFFSPLAYPDRWADSIARMAGRLGMSRGKVGLDYLPFPLLEQLQKKLPRVEFSPVFEGLLRMRAVKNSDEIKLLREAARMVDTGLDAGLRAIKPGAMEFEVYSKVVEATLREGSEGLPFSSILSSGKKALKDDLAANRRIRARDLVPMDTGAICNGYVGDAARTGLAGQKLSKTARELYHDHRLAFSSGVSKVGPGVLSSDVDEEVRRTLRELGRPVYEHATGHGLGLRSIEMPYIGPRNAVGSNDMHLAPGMVLVLEPTSRDTRVGVIRMEDMVLVTEGGCEVLTKCRFLDA